MKDALGHGSNARDGDAAQALASGNKSAPVPVKPGMRVEVQRSFNGAPGGAKSIGQVWQKVGTWKRRAVAEQMARYQRIDNPNSRVRIR